MATQTDSALTDIAAAEAPSAVPRIRLDFLDGLRGLAALYVVVYHQWLFFWRSDSRNHLSPALLALMNPFRFGRIAVAVFIVLSGFCLMMPVASSANGELRGGFWGYIVRRARRILPPYYAALVLAILLKHEWHLGAGNLISHILLLHNLKFSTNQSISGPFWSVATEWQIYFFLPLMLLPIRARFGRVAMVAIGFAVGYTPHLLLPHGNNLDWAAPWYLGLFALGMLGADLVFSSTGQKSRAHNLPWGIITAALALLFVAYAALFQKRDDLDWIQADLIIGLLTLCLLVYCAQTARSRPIPSWSILRLLDTRWAVKLGHFSYSLYLLHGPISWNVFWACKALSLSPNATLVTMLFIGIPINLALAYLFHLAVERRFMSRGMKARDGVQ